jgi:hypothetical protein
VLLRLVAASRSAGIWTLQAGIFRRITPACASHEKALSVLGVASASMLAGWRDVLMERRSAIAGI